MTVRTLAAAAVVAGALAQGCSSNENPVIGVVTDVSGNLAGVESFELRTPDGRELTVDVTDGLLFDGGPAISHLRDHLRSGEPIELEYATRPDGSLVVVAIRDGSAR